MELGALLAAVEEAAPAGVADSLGQELVRTVAADHVALLIANFSGSALVRLSHVSGADVDRHGRNGRAETVPLPGTVYERVVFSQMREVVHDGDKWLALVPVTERGDAIGVLEAAFSHEPDSDTLGQLVAATHALAYALIASRRHTDLFEWAQRDVPFSIPRRSSAGCCHRPTRSKQGR